MIHSVAFFGFSMLMMAGVWSRTTTFLSAVTLYYYYYRFGVALGQDDIVHHHTYFLMITTLLLSLTPCGRSYSFDRYLAVAKARSTGQPLPPEEELEGSGCFGRVSMHRHIWRCTYDPDDYVALMRTQSNHILLGEPVLARLCDKLRAAVDAHGGRIEVEYHARLCLAKTPNGPPDELA